jgi:cell division transport system permease protein
MSLGFSIKEGIKGFGRARMASFITVTSVALALMMIGLFLVLALNIDHWVEQKRKNLEIEVFFEQSLPETKARALTRQIGQWPGVRAVQFVSRQQAAERFKKEFGRDVTEVLGTNPLPASCIIKLKPAYQNAASIRELSEKIKKLNGVTDVIYGQELLNLIDRYVTLIYLIIGGLGLVLLIVAIVLVHNSIRLIIYARREIIEIMKLVGATRAFIRRPFLVEGLLYGLIGGTVADLVIWGVMRVSKTWIFSGLIDRIEVYAIILIVGILIGLFSSEVSVNKHLNRLI